MVVITDVLAFLRHRKNMQTEQLFQIFIFIYPKISTNTVKL